MKIRRTGRHTTPSQVEKVAAQAGKAAPAMAIAGVLVAVPHAQHAAASVKPAATAVASSHEVTSTARATLDSASAKGAGVATAHQSAAKALTSTVDYTVKSGDTLSGIAQTYYHKASDWQWLYHENDSRISDPNEIYPGQSLTVPADPPANYTLPDYAPRHAKPAATTSSSTSYSSSDSSDSGGNVVTQATSQSSDSTASSSSSGASTDTGSGSTTLSGTLDCSGLEQLWEDAGGNPSDAFMAAEIAMAESGGNQYALSPTDDFGYWQINGSHGPAMATFNALGNAKAAVAISADGSDWDPWTTFTSGAYAGRC
jgi:LysM repeat protein